MKIRISTVLLAALLAGATAAGDPGEADMRAILTFAHTDVGRKVGQMHTTPAGQLKQCAPQS